MMNVKDLAKDLYKDENGQGMVEYALILALIAVVTITILTTMGTTIKDKYQQIVNGLTGTTP